MLQLPSWYNGDKDSRFEHCNRLWLTHAGQAGTKAMMPNIVQLENIKNSWVRLVPFINHADTFFTGLNNQEKLKL
jgi:hypothetical protein